MRYIPLFGKKIIWAVQYMKLTVMHKWFVMVVGLRLGVPLWRLLKHDLSKFRWCEIWGYGRQFFGDELAGIVFAKAWLHHQNTNDHHWEYWIPRSAHTRVGYYDNAPMEMPEHVMLEMVADWFAAGRAYQGKWPDPRRWAWYNDRFHKMHLHMKTRRDIEELVRNMKRDPKWWLSKLNSE